MSSLIIKPILSNHSEFNNPDIPFFYPQKQEDVIQSAVDRFQKEKNFKTTTLKHSKAEVTLDMKNKAVQNVLKKFRHYPKKLLKYVASLK